jgi:hypothetical protein
MKRQEEWIDKAMNSTNGLIQAQPSDNLRTKTLLRMKAASKQNIFSIPLFWAVAASIALIVCVNIGVLVTSNDTKITEVALAETDWYAQSLVLDLNE